MTRHDRMRRQTLRYYERRGLIRLVRSLVRPSCDLQILDLRAHPAAQAKARQYGIKRVPAVAVDGKLADCCQAASIDEAVLRRLGVGGP